jgi:hypothetical protein
MTGPPPGGPPATGLRPARVCAELLEALASSEGRSRKRKRDQRPDAIGMGIKRGLLEAAVEEDPDPDDFEGWLLDRVLEGGPGSGAIRAMALQVFEEWRLARHAAPFRGWLADGAPSADRDPPAAPEPR